MARVEQDRLPARTADDVVAPAAECVGEVEIDPAGVRDEERVALGDVAPETQGQRCDRAAQRDASERRFEHQVAGTENVDRIADRQGGKKGGRIVGVTLSPGTVGGVAVAVAEVAAAADAGGDRDVGLSVVGGKTEASLETDGGSVTARADACGHIRLDPAITATKDDVDHARGCARPIDTARRRGQRLDAFERTDREAIDVGLIERIRQSGQARHPTAVDQHERLGRTQATQVDFRAGRSGPANEILGGAGDLRVGRKMGAAEILDTVGVRVFDGPPRRDLVRLDIARRSPDVAILGAVADDQDFRDRFDGSDHRHRRGVSGGDHDRVVAGAMEA